MGALGFRLRVLLIGLLLEILTGVESVPTSKLNEHSILAWNDINSY